MSANNSCMDLRSDPRTAAAASRKWAMLPGGKSPHGETLLSTLEPAEAVEWFFSVSSGGGVITALTTQRLVLVEGVFRPRVTDLPRPLEVAENSGRFVSSFTIRGGDGGSRTLVFPLDEDEKVIRSAHGVPPQPMTSSGSAGAAPRHEPSGPGRDSPFNAGPERRSESGAGWSENYGSRFTSGGAFSGIGAWWQQAEAVTLQHMVNMGFTDSFLTNSGADGGLDVAGGRAAAQVKWHSKPVGSPDVRNLVGAAHSHEYKLFYSASGYTPAAKKYANEAGVCLFRLGLDGAVVAENVGARTLATTAAAKSEDWSHRMRLQRERRAEEKLELYAQEVASRAKALIRELSKQSGAPSRRRRKKAAKALNQTTDALGALTSALKGGQPISRRKSAAKSADRKLKSIARDRGIKFL